MYITLIEGCDEYVTHNGEWITLPGSVLHASKGKLEVIAYSAAKLGIDCLRHCLDQITKDSKPIYFKNKNFNSQDTVSC